MCDLAPRYSREAIKTTRMPHCVIDRMCLSVSRFMRAIIVLIVLIIEDASAMYVLACIAFFVACV